MREALCLILFGALAAGQTPAPRYRVSFSHQPLEVFKAAFLTKLPSVAMYEAVICNTSTAPGAVSGGLILQAAATHVDTINPRMVEATAGRARSKSKKYIAAELTKWAALVATTLISGGTISASTSVAVVFPVLVTVGDRLAKQYDASAPPVSSFGPWLAADEAYNLAPSACTSRLFLGSWSGKFSPFAEEIP